MADRISPPIKSGRVSPRYLSLRLEQLHHDERGLNESGRSSNTVSPSLSFLGSAQSPRFRPLSPVPPWHSSSRPKTPSFGSPHMSTASSASSASSPAACFSPSSRLSPCDAFPTICLTTGCQLLDLTHDLLHPILRRGRILDALRPESAIALSSTCHEMNEQLGVCLRSLRERHLAVRALCRKVGTSPVELARASSISWDCKGLNCADCTVLGDLLASGSLDSLTSLTLHGNDVGDRGTGVLLHRLGTHRRSVLPQLRTLGLAGSGLGDGAALVLARAVAGTNGVRALPALRDLQLTGNRIGSTGLAILGRALQDARSLPQLQRVWMAGNQFARRSALEFRTALVKRSLGLDL
jgi:hypothetical protein